MSWLPPQFWQKLSVSLLFFPIEENVILTIFGQKKTKDAKFHPTPERGGGGSEGGQKEKDIEVIFHRRNFLDCCKQGTLTEREFSVPLTSLY